MHVFVTGASGFVGSAIVKELLDAGHQVTGLVRSEQAAAALISAGASVHHGTLDDPQSIRQGIKNADAVIHTAFNHDFTRFKENCETDRKVILALGKELAGTDRPLVVTSGIGVVRKNGMITEADLLPGSDTVPRAATEEAANALAAEGINTYIVRLPPTVHGKGDHGFIPMVIGMAKDKGVSAYIGEGQNRWAAVHRLDSAVLYRLIVEKQPAQKVLHAVAEEGIPFRDIATAIGAGLHVPVAGVEGKDIEAHFGWFTHFASIDCLASASTTKTTLSWQPQKLGLLEELVPGIYF